MSPLELVGDFDQIAKELRASRPVASAALARARGRTRRRRAEPRWSFHRPSRRLVLGLAAAALLAVARRGRPHARAEQAGRLKASRPTLAARGLKHR